jgi:hypothetical protein
MQPHAASSPLSHDFSMGRFLADQEQKCPLELRTHQTAAETEAAARSRMLVKIQGFQEQFSSSSEPKAS